MTAWDILQGNSNAPVDSTAWVHLNNQGTFSGGGGDIYVGGDLSMSISPTLSMDSNTSYLTMSIEPSLTMNLEIDDLSVNIHNDSSMDSGI